MMLDYDYIVIGSGFGGSVMTFRLAEKGYRVCLLERGRQWGLGDFPRRPHEVQQNMFWDPKEKKYGLMEFRDTPGSDVMSLTASGLGGGSLIYANVLYKMPAEFFKGWPRGISRESLDPYYDRVLAMMEAKPYPIETDPYYRDTPKANALKKIAEELSPPAKYVLPPLGVRFEGEFPRQQSVNSHGALQAKCNKCGECNIGCNIHAKNSLDLNYLYRSQKMNEDNRPDIRTHAEVSRIEKVDGHYVVTYNIPESPQHKRTFTAKNVVLSAGSIGSTSLLLRMKKEGHLKYLNKWLGKKWCGNGDLIGVILKTKEDIDPTNGPVITGTMEFKGSDYPDGYPHGLYLQEAGYPIGWEWYLSGKIPQMKGLKGLASLVGHHMKKYIFKKLKIEGHDKINVGYEFAGMIDRAEFSKKSLLILGMGRDRSDGEIQLRDDNQAVIRWKIAGSRLHFDRMREHLNRVAEVLKGVYVDSPLTYLNKLITVHPLGGCPMGDSPETGFVNSRGQVFGYEGLYVVDGSILPTSTGPNPSLTIAAMAEYIAESIPNKVK